MTELDVGIDLDLIKESHDHVVSKSRQLDEEGLKEFIMETLKHESFNLKQRKKKFDAEEIEEEDLNDFEFYTDGYRSGVSVFLNDENLLKMKVYDKDGNVKKEVEAKILYKKIKNKNTGKMEYAYDDEGNKIPSGRVIFRIKSRLGGMGVFLGTKKFQALQKDQLYVLVGQLNAQYYNLTTRSYESEKNETDKYGENPSYSLNGFQFGQVKRKGKGLQIITPDLNFKSEEDE